MMDFGDESLLCNEDFDTEIIDFHEDSSSTTPTNTTQQFMAIFPDESAALQGIFQREADHLPEQGYVDALRTQDAISSARSNAVHWIMKVSNVYSFSPLTIALAVNYLDRYFSRNLLKWKGFQPWMIQIISVACLSLAAKMEETEVHLLQDLQIEGLDHIFESKYIQRMEIAVMRALDWRMSPVTPFAYLESLFSELDIHINMKLSLLHRVSELLTKTLAEMDLLDFRPSVISLAAVCCALEELIPVQADVQKGKLLRILPIEEANVHRCYKLMEELVVDPLCPLLSLSHVLENHKVSPSPTFSISQGIPHVVQVVERDSRNWDQSGKAQNSCVKSVKRKLDEFLT